MNPKIFEHSSELDSHGPNDRNPTAMAGAAKNKELFEEDYEVYADRGPNCIDWSDPFE